MDARDELIAIVDENNQVVGAASRGVMRRFSLPHRATYILVFNSRGELFVQQRTATKDIYPGFYCPATGGVVAAGETYEESAARELAEELGVRGVPLETLFDFYHEDPGDEANDNYVKISGNSVHASVSGHRVPQIRDQRRQQCRQRGLGAGLVLREQADDKGDAVPCGRLRNKVWGRAFSCLWDGGISLQAEEVAGGSFMTVEGALALAEREDFTPDGLYALRRWLER